MNEYEKLIPILEKQKAYRMAESLFSWDSETLAPKKAMDYTAKIMGILSMEGYRALVNPEVKALLVRLSSPEQCEELTGYRKAIVKKLKKDMDNLEKIPPKEYQEYAELTAMAQSIWEKAKKNNDYESYRPTLEKVFSYQKKFAGYCKKENQTEYEYLLDENEEGFTTEVLDAFFDKLKEHLVPLIHKIGESKTPVDESFLSIPTDIGKQKEFCRFVAQYIGFDFERGVLAESEHPFTNEMHKKDVRLTTHYYPNAFMSAIFSAIHEGGHGIYEQDIDDELVFTPLGGGTSMGVHESQSRLYENNIGRSRAFWVPLYPKLKSAFPEALENVSLEEFYHAINAAKPSLIRTEADELTYPLHIMIRYELERELFEGTLDFKELPDAWNKKYEAYLGITPPNDREGVLQDVHWSFGGFGYFPSYAIGSAIAAQLMHDMKKKFPVDELLEKGDMEPIRKYLEENIHHFGGTKKAEELLKETTGEGFNPKYYVEYLEGKFREIYDF